METRALDRQRLLEALSLAEGSCGLSDPNPRVGCVIGTESGAVVGRGATQQAGGPHAEVMALRDALAAGQTVRGATAWVTLEPCAHHGRTPPCCDALIEVGIRRVVIAVKDPFPQVDGAGLDRLRAAGVQVEMADADIAAAARELNIGFFSRIERGRPWVRLKIAASADGRTALPDGRSQWITGADARRDGHSWRRRAGAVVTGIGTVLADDPRMDVRLVPSVLQPLRVVLDSHLRLLPGAQILQGAGGVLIFTTQQPGPRGAALREAGAEIEVLPDGGRQPMLHAVVAALARRQINEVHVEAGATLNGAWLASGLVDELLIYLAPLLIGAGRGMADLPALQDLASADRWQWVDIRQIGADLRLRARAANGHGEDGGAASVEPSYSPPHVGDRPPNL